jgi:multidrug resistance efflux pump
MLVSFDPTTLRERLMAKQNERDATQVELEKRRFEIALETKDEALQLAEAEAEVRKAQISADQSDELTGALIIKQAKLDLQAAEAKVEHLKGQLKRRQQNNQAELALLEAKVRAADKEVELLTKQIEEMTVKATRSGTVIYGTRGYDKYKVGDSVWRMGTALEVASLDRMEAEGKVDEADSAQLRVGQVVRLRLEAHPDQEITGKLTEIDKTVKRKSRDIPTKVVAVKLSIDPVEEIQLRPGMRFRGDIETEVVEAATVVPFAAVFAAAKGPVAYRQKGDEVEHIELTLGKRGKRAVQVLEGLEPGDRVSTSRRPL